VSRIGSEDVSKSANLPGETESALWFGFDVRAGTRF